ncbi:MAG: stalk domain-containing protein [Peptoniphilus harei]|uniref:stalk domain-containing protein n=1 Tax=Peptoniphilus harei TaxID=54005 RepID=UPI0029108FE7|nr:stalk domain-containing protein [Peptoniphilus harei]MDU5470236.1 stalk domain-containing protein [Peptoniphilus harei]MDU6098029.1 stalk domain-containing protein [Peptoniphilus harei]
MKKIKNTLISSLLIMSLIPTCVLAAGQVPPSASDKNINIMINGERKNPPQEMGSPYLDMTTQRTMVPLRFISENLGFKVDFLQKSKDNPKGGIVIRDQNNVEITMEINSKNATRIKGGKKESLSLDSPSLIYDGRTYVPIRFISEATGYQVSWEKDTVIISSDCPVIKSIAEEETKEIAKNLEPEDKMPTGSVGDSNKFMKNLMDYRISKGLGQVNEDKELNRLALLRAQEELDQFIKTGDADHESPGGYNKDLGENLALSRYTLGARDGDPCDGCLKRWKNSPCHNDNLLNKDSKRGGYACARKIIDNKVYEASIYLFGF